MHMFDQGRPGPPGSKGRSQWVHARMMKFSDAFHPETSEDDRKEELPMTGRIRYTYHSKIKKQ